MTDRYVEYMSLDDIAPAPRNPKSHDTAAISRSIGHFGLAELPLVDERTGRLVAGHGRYDQLQHWRSEGKTPPEGVRVEDDGTWHMPVVRGWASRSDDDAEAYLVASNRLTVTGGWDDRMLAEVLSDLGESQLLDLTGYEEGDLADLVSAMDDDDTGEDGDGSQPLDKGEAANLVGVTVGEPDYTTATGQVWRLDRHHLVVDDVHTGWPLWSPYLTGESIFWPYPTMLAPFASQAQKHPVVMVQPLPFFAGWLLTKYRRVSGEEPELVHGEQAAAA